jgi:hypothetical protein
MQTVLNTFYETTRCDNTLMPTPKTPYRTFPFFPCKCHIPLPFLDEPVHCDRQCDWSKRWEMFQQIRAGSPTTGHSVNGKSDGIFLRNNQYLRFFSNKYNSAKAKKKKLDGIFFSK